MFGGEVVKAFLDVLGQKRGDLGCFCGGCWGSRNERPPVLFIAVTMVRVMLLFFGKVSFEGRFFSRYGKRDVGA
ncbi:MULTISPECIES: hypothetical protein [unclassified Bartonella]|uniref:hypothetical protein n=1 Tax=unclassified Bartonella TaxID=2645622 RepID=UPI0035D06152